jgi:hypothetical protein
MRSMVCLGDQLDAQNVYFFFVRGVIDLRDMNVNCPQM